VCYIHEYCQASEDDLTPEYKEERNKLLEELKNGITPKEKNGILFSYSV